MRYTQDLANLSPHTRSPVQFLATESRLQLCGANVPVRLHAERYWPHRALSMVILFTSFRRSLFCISRTKTVSCNVQQSVQTRVPVAHCQHKYCKLNVIIPCMPVELCQPLCYYFCFFTRAFNSEREETSMLGYSSKVCSNTGDVVIENLILCVCVYGVCVCVCVCVLSLIHI